MSLYYMIIAFVYSIYFCCIILFGNAFLKLSISGVRPTEVIFLISLYIVFNERSNVSKLPIMKSTITFALLGILYILISFLGLNDQLTDFYDRSFILRQAYYTIYMFPITFGLFIIYKQLFKSDKITMYLWMILMSCLLNRALVSFGLSLGDGTSSTGVFPMVENLIISYFLFFSKRRVIKVFSFAYLYFFFFQSSQGLDKLIFLLLIVILIFNVFANVSINRMTSFMGLVIGTLFILYLYGLDYELREIDVNTWWRIHLWDATLTKALDGYGLGLGFGTEYYPIDFLYLQYEFNPELKVLSYIETDEIFKHGPHNSFITVFLRMGVLGLISYLMIYLRLLKGINITFKHINQRMFLSYNLIAQVLFVGLNMGLESPRYFMGVCFVLSIVCFCLKYPKVLKMEKVII